MTQEGHVSGISQRQSYSQTAIAPESDRGERFVMLVTGFQWRMQRGKKKNAVHNHLTFKLGLT